MVAVIPKPDFREFAQAAHEQPGDDQQNQGKGHLSHHQNLAEGRAAAARSATDHAARCSFQNRAEIDARRPKRRSQTKEKSGKKGNSESESQDTSVEMSVQNNSR